MLFNILFTLALKYLNPIGNPQATIFEEALEEKHANYTGEELSSGGRLNSKTSGLSSHSLGALTKGIHLAMRRSSISLGGLSDQIEAWLCLPTEVDAQKQNIFVEEVMELVGLLPLRHALVGLPEVNGLSTEQRKRLTIAVELVANPSIILMDLSTTSV